jgi:uncharacterized protein YqiB (DUF1249 family)
MVMAKLADNRPYHVDLSELMRVYETNYAKLNRLIPFQPSVGDIRCYQAGRFTYQLEVSEVTKYTTLVEIFQDDELPVFPLPKMTVRLYHDAKVAEVCHCESATRVKARYDYPNAKMLQRDEKFQLNQFLSDWLTFCLKNGISRAPIMYRG